MFLEPVYEPSSTWFANSNSLRGSGVRRHIGGSNIDHHVFLGGRDGGGAIGIAWLGTACVRSPRGKNRNLYNVIPLHINVIYHIKIKKY